ncbi:MAG: EAL domain-containing protein [Paraglaciecola sp.]|uniref:putative bifunctional diguanylate cyclase/phosphodiesterase n=1 Tax=Paraglaciecola sp. TaxID=1920173 RepID=UPI003298A878
MINETPPAKPAFHEDVAELLYGNALAGILVTLLASSLLVFGFPSPELQTYKLSWWAIISALMVIRLVDVFYWRKRKTQQNYNSKKAVSRFVTGTFASSIMWSIFCLYNSQYATSTELACMIIIVSALAGGAATVLAAHKITAMTYSLIMLGPFSLSLLLSNEQYQQVLGSLGLAFSLVMMITAKKSADFTTNAIHLKNDNAALVNQMEQKVARRTAKIYQLSNLDPLTGLFNRSAFIHHLQKQLAVSQENDIPIALLFIDLDGFKKINDSLGHDTGDKVLKLTARRLEKFCDEQHLLCRWGGDEFLIASIGANQQTADKDAKKVIDAISEYYDFESNRLSIGATIGIALYPEHASKSNELIQLADTAMYYQKKKQPRSVGVFNQEMGQRLFREQRLKTALAEAINQQQLRMVYQPIVDAQSHEVIAFEALLRWNLDGENVPPDEFINLAEQYGLINSIGNWVLQQSCIAASQWIEANTAIQPLVSVNVSVLQLHNANFIEIVRSALSNAQLDPEKLTIEITESIFSDDKEIIFQRIKQLQSMGIKVSIDDFGTEYSSLSVIQDLAVNTVKIDRSFVNKLSSNGMAIIEAVNQMASSLNYEVIAEGVETQQQVQILSDLGIEMLQGYYFSKPLERDKVIPYINQHLS